MLLRQCTVLFHRTVPSLRHVAVLFAALQPKVICGIGGISRRLAGAKEEKGEEGEQDEES